MLILAKYQLWGGVLWGFQRDRALYRIAFHLRNSILDSTFSIIPKGRDGKFRTLMDLMVPHPTINGKNNCPPTCIIPHDATFNPQN